MIKNDKLVREMTDSSLMRGEDWVRCCICGELHTKPYPNLVIEDDGSRWDICKGECAMEAGISDET